MSEASNFLEDVSKEDFSEKIKEYYQEHGREFPWRRTDNVLTPYSGRKRRQSVRELNYFEIKYDSLPSQNDEIWELASELLPEDHVREYNLALIDYGADLYGKNP